VRLAYADPPYPGRSHLYFGHSDYAGEVDHRRLIADLDRYDGWALSTDTRSLKFVLSICSADVWVAAWVRPNSMPYNPDRRGPVRSWEPVVYRPARVKVDDPDRVRDVLVLACATGHQAKEIPGTKPRGFGRWLFGLLGAETGDDFCDLFPGTGGVGAEWDAWEGQPSLFARALGGSGSASKNRSELRKQPVLGVAAVVSGTPE